MKVIWEESDIRAGRRVGKPDRAERWMICYFVDARMPTYSLVSLSDGMLAISYKATARQMVEHLNAAGELPAELLGPL